MNGPIELTWLDLALAAALIGSNALVSIWLRLAIEKRLLIASLRTVVQLVLLGWVLVPVFRWQSPLLVGVICLLMVVMAAREALGRVSRKVPGMGGAAFFSIALGGGSTVLMATVVIIQVDPWWEPQYIIPLLGMILGNSLNGVSLGMDRCLDALDSGRDKVEALLSRGATWWEAARPVATESIRTGMIPILNSMSAVGIVSIPGMMTGQILGGTAPEQAARYQVLIMFLIASAVAVGVTGSVLIILRLRFDRDHRLRPSPPDSPSP